MNYEIQKEKYTVHFDCNGIITGKFCDIKLLKTPFFSAEIKNMQTGESKFISSFDLCGKTVIKAENSFLFSLTGYDINFETEVICESDGISFFLNVKNESTIYSVMNVTYPTPKISADYFDIFEPSTCGKVSENAGVVGYKSRGTYPATSQCMQYFAFYGKNGGIYLGAHDGTGGIKRTEINAENGEGFLKISYPAEGANSFGNSFKVPGYIRWQSFEGDWYDATMIYKNFVLNHAEWIPEYGRPDTAEKFRDIPFWICDYIPNSSYQRDNMPASISAGSDIYEKDYWYTAAIKLKKELATPVAYHVYNWHHIPFNVEYPHFMPPKDEFYEGLKKLRDEDIYVMPYTNAVSWDTKDAICGHEINFENTGIHGAVYDRDGNVFACDFYPQTTNEGEKVLLAPICPSFEKWHEIIYDTVRKMENTLDINGIYFDEIAAHPPRECYNKNHSHPLGGGTQWVKNYNKMMKKIKKDRPSESFYFTESNGEAYMKNFDGFLTWMWVQNGEVPAFPTVYAGYVQMVGRCTLGKKKDDFEFFKFCTAKSLLYGQQIGWYKADVVYKEKWLDFLKKTVRLKYDLRHFFKYAHLLAPLDIKTNLPEKVTSPAMHYTEDIRIPQILGAAWQSGDTVKIIIVNLSDNIGSFKIDLSRINRTFDTGNADLEGVLSATEYKVFTFDKN